MLFFRYTVYILCFDFTEHKYFKKHFIKRVSTDCLLGPHRRNSLLGLF